MRRLRLSTAIGPCRTMTKSGLLTSLDILAPRSAWIPESEPNAAKQLEHLSVDVVNCPTTKGNPSQTYELLSPAHTMVVDGLVLSTNRDGTTAVAQIARQENGRFSVEVMSTCSSISEDGRRARVWVTGRVTSCRHETLERETVVMLVW